MKKILLIFDLNHTLMYVGKNQRIQSFDYNQILNSKKPNYVMNQQPVYFRPSRNELLDFLFMKNKDFYDVGVWSSQDKEKTQDLSKQYFERYYRNLQFVLATRRDEYEGNLASYSPEPIKIKRNIQQIFEKFPEHDLNNTIIISTIPNQLEQYRSNDLILPSYTPNSIKDSFFIDSTMLSLTKYLRGIQIMTSKDKRIEDVRVLLNSKSFQFIQQRVQNNLEQYDIVN